MLTGTISGPMLDSMLSQAAALGADAAVVLEGTGVTVESLADPDLRIPRRVLYHCWSRLGAQVPGACGLRIAQQMQRGSFAVIDYVVRNSPTLGGAYQHLCRYIHLLHNGVDVRFSTTNGLARIRYQEPLQSPRHLAEWAVASWLMIGRQATRVEWRPSKVTFQHAQPSDLREHQRFFGVRPRFGASDSMLEFDASVLRHPIVGADPKLLAVIERYAQAQLATATRERSIREAALTLIAEGLIAGKTTLAHIAAGLHASPSTVKRRLREEGVSSYRQLLDEARHALAVRHLSDSKISTREVSILVGFSDPRSFDRAFRRWTGSSPAQFRRKAPAAEPVGPEPFDTSTQLKSHFQE